jgi:hypothetical protein
VGGRLGFTVFPHIVDEPFFVENDRPLWSCLIARNHFVKVGRKRGELALGRRDGVREGEPDVSALANVEIARRRRTRRRRITTEVEEVITSRGVGALAEGKLEELLAGEEVLGGATIPVADLADEGVAPASRESKTEESRRGDIGVARKFEVQDDVLDAVVPFIPRLSAYFEFGLPRGSRLYLLRSSGFAKPITYSTGSR